MKVFVKLDQIRKGTIFELKRWYYRSITNCPQYCKKNPSTFYPRVQSLVPDQK